MEKLKHTNMPFFFRICNQEGGKELDGREVPHFCADPQCPGDINRSKLQAAEEMAKQLAAFVEWVQDGALSSSDRAMFVRRFQVALIQWEKAGKGKGE